MVSIPLLRQREEHPAFIEAGSTISLVKREETAREPVAMAILCR